MIDRFRVWRRCAAAGALAAALVVAAPAFADEVGEVSTAFKLLGANHKIVVEAFDNPGVEGVSCFVSRAKTGGISGSLGLAEDTSDASIACRQTGPVAFKGELGAGERVFRERRSEAHTSELQSLMRSSHAVFCLRK